ncbi:Aste57867_4289 [Aphanomyces stellatus]|uniref:Aste57867_4289 protein n=1 Tax=Aphanomyces stellatus TaxID=120398 RepID=A0A485KFM7_9STRA|nr:hypothetical protein As57867_004278 [Aphanomyces stellatus]VFT81404.1 Aste57867_4289 [Aphanomyces stellatus]
MLLLGLLSVALLLVMPSADTSADPNIARPEVVVIEHLRVTFGGSVDDVFRFQATVPSGNTLPMRIWLESTTSKKQWSTIVTNFKTHMPTGETNELPPDAIVAGLQLALDRVANKQKTELNGCDVTLSDAGDDGHLELVLEMKAFQISFAMYTFQLSPLWIDKLGALEAKVRGFQETSLGAIQKLENRIPDITKSAMPALPPQLSLHTWSKTDMLADFEWGPDRDFNKSYFRLLLGNKRMTVVSIRRPGVYQIQVRGIIGRREKIHGHQMLLYVENVLVWSSDPPLLDNGVNSFWLSYTLVAAKSTRVRLHHMTPLGYKQYPMEKGARMTIQLLQELMPQESRGMNVDSTCWAARERSTYE